MDKLVIVDNVIQQDEGGWVLSRDADGADGGWTFGGVTATNYNAWIKENFPTYAVYSYEDMKVDTTTLARKHIIENCIQIYLQKFWTTSHCDKLAPEHQQMFFSALINCGQHSAVKILQAACGCEAVDGAWGPSTEGHYADRLNDDVFRNTFCMCWQLHYEDICKHNPAKLPDLHGWTNRVNRYRKKGA